MVFTSWKNCCRHTQQQLILVVPLVSCLLLLSSWTAAAIATSTIPITRNEIITLSSTVKDSTKATFAQSAIRTLASTQNEEENVLGYDTTTGTQALCWRTLVSLDNATTTTTTTTEHDEHLSLGMHSPALENWVCDPTTVKVSLQPPSRILPSPSSLLRATEPYRYQEEIELDWHALVLQLSDSLYDSEEDHEHNDETEETTLTEVYVSERRCSLKLLFCTVGQTGFCTPFIHDEAEHIDEDDNLDHHESLDGHEDLHSTDTSTTHVDASVLWFDLDPAGSDTIRINQTIDTTIPLPGTYFPLAVLQFYTAVENIMEGNSTAAAHEFNEYRWDIANALSPLDSRVVNFVEPIVIAKVSDQALMFSYGAIGVATLMILGLLWQTIKHRNDQVLNLSQADFLVFMLIAALVATVSSSFLHIKNELYCQISYPLVLIPIHVMYSIILGRLWRINALVSPLLLEQYRKKKNGSGCAAWATTIFQYLVGLQSEKQGMRQTVSSRQLGLVVCYLTLPHVVFQLCGLILQPQHLVLDMNSDESIGIYTCSGGEEWYKTYLTYAFVCLLLLIGTLLVVAFSSRKLPSLFNETSVINSAAINTLTLITLGVMFAVISDDQASNPDVQYLMEMAVILSLTLGTSLRLMLPKLRMVWKGEAIVVSKLVSDHNRHQREKELLRQGPQQFGTLQNVTGLSDPPSGGNSGNWSHESQDTTVGGLYYTSSPSKSPSSGFFTIPGKGGTDNTSNAISTKNNCSLPGDDGANRVTEEGASDDPEAAISIDSLPLPIPSTGSGSGRLEELKQRREHDKTQVLECLGSVLDSPQSRLQVSLRGSNQCSTRARRPSQSQDLTKKKSQRKRHPYRVDPAEAPPQRLVLKLVELQNELEEMNRTIMTGVAVDPEQWDAVDELVRCLEKKFREDIQFSWRDKSAPTQKQASLKMEQKQSS